MEKPPANQDPQWDDQLSQAFIDLGPYCVPDRELQMRLLADLIPELEAPQFLIELGCGEGLLAEILLERFPGYHLLALDRSPMMLGAASTRLARFGERVYLQEFSLFDKGWRSQPRSALAILSSLTIHHLDGPQKLELFTDLLAMLAPGGVLAIADLIEPAHPQGMRLAASAWDDAVRERALSIDGNLRAFQSFEAERWNTFRYPDPDDIDHPSRLLDQLRWMEQVGFVAVDVHWMGAGHAIFSGWKPGLPPTA